MHRWRYWGVLVGGGLTAGALLAGTLLHAGGYDTTARQVEQSFASGPVDPLAVALANHDAGNVSAVVTGNGTPAYAGKIAPESSLIGSIVTQVDPPAPASTPHSLFETSQIVSYYGHPLAAAMGVLGEGPESAMLARLRAQVAAYQAVNPDKTVVPALHLIYEVAQASTSADGLYLYRTEDQTVQHYIQLAQDQNMLLFLDLQIGRSSLQAELQYVLPYLKLPFVHLAIDPEFVTPPGSRPGLDIGTLDCLDINAALDTIESMAEANDLPNKIVIVHQFQSFMLSHKEQLNFNEPRVDVVLNMDGFGDQSGKLGNYDRFVRQAGARYGGIKLFYKYDVGLLTEQQVENIDPRPSVIIYQ